MANSLQTKIRFPLCSSFMDSLIQEFPQAQVEEDYVFVLSRGTKLHEFLMTISTGYQGEIMAEHMSSIDRYTRLYVVQYKMGVCETMETKTDYMIFYEDRFSDIITDEVIKAIRRELEKFKKCDEVQFEYKADNAYTFKISKKEDMVEIDIVGIERKEETRISG